MDERILEEAKGYEKGVAYANVVRAYIQIRG